MQQTDPCLTPMEPLCDGAFSLLAGGACAGAGLAGHPLSSRALFCILQPINPSSFGKTNPQWDCGRGSRKSELSSVPKGCDVTILGFRWVPWVWHTVAAAVGSTGSVLGWRAQGLGPTRSQQGAWLPALPPWLVSVPGVALVRLASLCTPCALPSLFPKTTETPLLKRFAKEKYFYCLFPW